MLVEKPAMRLSLKSGTPHSEIGFPGRAFSTAMGFCAIDNRTERRQLRVVNTCFISGTFQYSFTGLGSLIKKIGNLQDMLTDEK
jgi:hypothetical protein